MISELGVRNFKRFRDARLDLRALTVFTGLNGTGKSTALQALLLGRQIVERPEASVVQLNGPYGLTLGDALEVLHFDAASDDICVAFAEDGVEYRYRFHVSDERSPYLHVDERPQDPPPALLGPGAAFTYLSAERLGPRDLLSVTSVDSSDVGVGEQGEYTAQVLAQYETQTVREELLYPGTGRDGVVTLRTQTEKWVSDIIGPIKISAQWPPGLHTSVLRFEKPGFMSDSIRPANVGFGFSYALPIIVAALRAPTGALLVVENPEAHLHPGGQSRLGRFLARAAGSGVQVLVETHSDHILNGIRLGVAEDRTLASEEALVYFFEESEQQPVGIGVDEHGKFAAWPAGFFDQIETDLGVLARARRRRTD